MGGCTGGGYSRSGPRARVADRAFTPPPRHPGYPPLAPAPRIVRSQAVLLFTGESKSTTVRETSTGLGPPCAEKRPGGRPSGKLAAPPGRRVWLISLKIRAPRG